MALTQTAVENAAGKDKQYWIWDKVIPGFGLLVLPTGFKTYYIRYYTREGVQRKTKVGRAKSIKLADAKQVARDILTAVELGRDPELERKQAKAAPDLRELAVHYMEQHGNAKRSGFNDESLWRRHLLPSLGSTRVSSLSREQVRLFHARHPRPVTANRAVEVLSKAMDLAIDWGWREAGTNPCQGLRHHPEKKRRRYLDEPELRRLLGALDGIEEAYGEASLRWRFCQLVRLLMLTGARLREVMEAEWSWVKWNHGLLIVPAAQHKTGDDGLDKEIILSDQALQILRQLQAQGLSDQWVIAGARPNRPLVGYRKMWVELRDTAKLQDFRLHDLRHTFASQGISNGYSLEVIGGLLGHRSPQTTARYAHLMRQAAAEAARNIGQSLS